MFEVPVSSFRFGAMYEVGLGKEPFSVVRFFPNGLEPLRRVDAIVVRAFGLVVREARTLLQGGYLECKNGDKTMLETPLHTVVLAGSIVPYFQDACAFALLSPWLLQEPRISAIWPESLKLCSDNATIRVEVYARKSGLERKKV